MPGNKPKQSNHITSAEPRTQGGQPMVRTLPDTSSTRPVNMESWRREARNRSEVCLKRLITERIQDDGSAENVKRMMDESRGRRTRLWRSRKWEKGHFVFCNPVLLAAALLHCRRQEIWSYNSLLFWPDKSFRSFNVSVWVVAHWQPLGDDFEINTSAKTDVESKRRGSPAESTLTKD